MAPRVPNAKVPNAKYLLPRNVGRTNKYVSKVEYNPDLNSFDDALAIVEKFSDAELSTRFTHKELLEMYDSASVALHDSLRDLKDTDIPYWYAGNKFLLDRLKNFGSETAELVDEHCKRVTDRVYKEHPNIKKEVDAYSKELDDMNNGFSVRKLPPASPAETSSGALTDPPKELPKVNANTPPVNPAEPKSQVIIREPVDDAELVELANKGSERTYTDRAGNTEINAEDMPAFLVRGNKTPLKEGVVVGPETPITPVGDSAVSAAEKPAAASSSPEAIGEAMRDAVSKDGTVTVPPEAVAEEVAKEKANPKVVTDGTEVKTAEAATGKAETPPKKGALTGEGEKTPVEPAKGMFGKTWDFLRNHKGKILGWGLGTSVPLGLAGAAIYDLASDDSTLKSLFKGDYSTEIPNISSANQPRVKSLDQREGAYMPERLLRFRQNTQEPFVNNTNVNVDTGSISSNEELPVQQEQQVVNAPAPVNNATADYVRTAYRSYIPSDAGRAYQKAIYGDPLELERMRLQQQQQKWRDFVMRSGQSPAELVQRGLMPYDALQYV